MEYRRLGGSGFWSRFSRSAPERSVAATNSSSTGARPARRRRRACSTSVSTPGSTCSTAPTSTPTASQRRFSARQLPAVATSVLISTKATFRHGAGPNDVGSSRFALTRADRRQPPPPGHRLHRSVSIARVRCADAGRGSARHPRRPRAGREDSLHRRVELLGLAPDEIAGCLRSLRLCAICRAPGVLLARSAANTSGS